MGKTFNYVFFTCFLRVFYVFFFNFAIMKKILLLLLLIFSFILSYSQEFEFDYLPATLNEKKLENEKYIKSHFLGSKIANKVKLLELAYKWIDPPTPTRLNSMIRIEKQPIYFAMSKIISTKHYRKKINQHKLTKDQARKQLCKILDIAIMIRYQDTQEFENYIRKLTSDEIIVVFTKNIRLSYF